MFNLKDNESMSDELKEQLKQLDHTAQQEIINAFSSLSHNAKTCVNQEEFLNPHQNIRCSISHIPLKFISESCIFLLNNKVYSRQTLKDYLLREIKPNSLLHNQPATLELSGKIVNVPLKKNNTRSRVNTIFCALCAFLLIEGFILDPLLHRTGIIRKNIQITLLKPLYDYCVSKLLDIDCCITNNEGTYPLEKTKTTLSKKHLDLIQQLSSDQSQRLTDCVSLHDEIIKSYPYPEALASSPTYYKAQSMMNYCINPKKNMDAVLHCSNQYHHGITDFTFKGTSIIVGFLFFLLYIVLFLKKCFYHDQTKTLNDQYDVDSFMAKISPNDFKQAFDFKKKFNTAIKRNAMISLTSPFNQEKADVTLPAMQSTI